MEIPNTVHVLGFTKNPEAMERTIKEVERAGFKALPFWNFPTPYNDFLANNMLLCNIMRKKHSFLSCSLGHYAIWQTSKGLREDVTFVVEDDCRFLKDIDVVHKTLANRPADADILLLDSFGPHREGGVDDFIRERAQARNGWVKVSAARSMGCYIVGRRMRDSLISLTERGLGGKIERICDQWLENARIPGVNIYCAVPNLAVQQVLPDILKRNSSSGNLWKYKKQGTDHGQYADW